MEKYYSNTTTNPDLVGKVRVLVVGSSGYYWDFLQYFIFKLHLYHNSITSIFNQNLIRMWENMSVSFDSN